MTPFVLASPSVGYSPAPCACTLLMCDQHGFKSFVTVARPGLLQQSGKRTSLCILLPIPAGLMRDKADPSGLREQAIALFEEWLRVLNTAVEDKVCTHCLLVASYQTATALDLMRPGLPTRATLG